MNTLDDALARLNEGVGTESDVADLTEALERHRDALRALVEACSYNPDLDNNCPACDHALDDHETDCPLVNAEAVLKEWTNGA